MTAPLYIVYGPLSIYVAAAGTGIPAYPTTAPSGSWVLLGTNGKEDLDESGVKVNHTQALNWFRGQHSGPVAGARTEEDLIFDFKLADVQISSLAKALNGQSISTTDQASGIPGFKKIAIYRGPGKITPVAILLRGTNSPSMDGGICEYYAPYAFQEGNVEPVYSKGEVRLLAFKYRVLEDPSGGVDRMGQYREQTSAAA